MLVVNRRVPTEEEIKKYLKPYAKNRGEEIDFDAAGQAAVEYFEQNPKLLKEAGDLLDKAQT